MSPFITLVSHTVAFYLRNESKRFQEHKKFLYALMYLLHIHFYASLPKSMIAYYTFFAKNYNITNVTEGRFTIMDIFVLCRFKRIIGIGFLSTYCYCTS